MISRSDVRSFALGCGVAAILAIVGAPTWAATGILGFYFGWRGGADYTRKIAALRRAAQTTEERRAA